MLITKAIEEEKKITGGLKKTLKRVIQGLIYTNDVKTFFERSKREWKRVVGSDSYERGIYVDQDKGVKAQGAWDISWGWEWQDRIDLLK